MLILPNYQRIIIKIALNDSPASSTRKSLRDYISIIFCL